MSDYKNTEYDNQNWTGSTPIDGERLSTNGYYTGNHIGKPMQGHGETEANADPYYVATKSYRYGTILQDKDPNANMPTKK